MNKYSPFICLIYVIISASGYSQDKEALVGLIGRQIELSKVVKDPIKFNEKCTSISEEIKIIPQEKLVNIPLESWVKFGEGLTMLSKNAPAPCYGWSSLRGVTLHNLFHSISRTLDKVRKEGLADKEIWAAMNLSSVLLHLMDTEYKALGGEKSAAAANIGGIDVSHLPKNEQLKIFAEKNKAFSANQLRYYVRILPQEYKGLCRNIFADAKEEDHLQLLQKKGVQYPKMLLGMP